MQIPRHLPVKQWPAADRDAFAMAYAPGDIFDETAGPGAHLTAGTRTKIETGYKRWLGFLARHHPGDLTLAPAERITRSRVRAYIETLEGEVRATTLAIYIDDLHYAARLIAPDRDWDWLRALKSRLQARAKPEDRFDRLVPPWLLLDLAFELMDWAVTASAAPQRARHIACRDGLLLGTLAIWPLRRRSITAMTVSGHMQRDADGITLLLYPEDTKAKRAESFRLPDYLLPHFNRYLDQVRPRFPAAADHDGLWASIQGRPLTGTGIYRIVNARIAEKFDKQMGLHDIRRSAATFIATTAPELVGITPGTLQQISPEVGEKHYNQARSTEASRRQSATITAHRDRLPRPRIRKKD